MWYKQRFRQITYYNAFKNSFDAFLFQWWYRFLGSITIVNPDNNLPNLTNRKACCIYSRSPDPKYKNQIIYLYTNIDKFFILFAIESKDMLEAWLA